METRIIRRTVIVETYIEVVPANSPAPIIEAKVVKSAPAPAPIAARPHTFTIGDRVEYTSKAGNTAEYRVFWIGSKDGQVRLGLKAKNRKNGFFVPADACKFLRKGK